MITDHAMLFLCMILCPVGFGLHNIHGKFQWV